VEQVPILWINRAPGMGVSSLRLANVGGGYWHFVMNLGSGAFSGLVRIATFPSMEVAPVTPALRKQTGTGTQICLSQQNIARRALK
jgi:hypothetical protein